MYVHVKNPIWKSSTLSKPIMYHVYKIGECMKFPQTSKLFCNFFVIQTRYNNITVI